MNITAITRYKHGDLYSVLQRIGWSQKDLARKTGIYAGLIGKIINLVRRPTAEQADAIQKAVGDAGEYIDVLSAWPESFEGLKRG
jgi:transcriptional regulator with XRE-family HTH domain